MSKALTLGKLKKIVDKLLEHHSPRRKVVVSIPTLDTGNGTWNCCDIHYADVEAMNICDDDGFTIENKDGSERTQTVMLLKGRFNDAMNPTKESLTAWEEFKAAGIAN